MIGKIIAAALIMTNVLTLSHAEMKDVPLSKNPFIKPTAAVAPTGDQIIITDIGETLTDRNLRATLTSSERSIANIDGMMIFVGDQVKGYTLISVGDGFATFVKNEKEITLNVSELHKKLK